MIRRKLIPPRTYIPIIIAVAITLAAGVATYVIVNNNADTSVDTPSGTP